MSRKFLILVLLILTGISFTYPQVLYGNVDVKGIWQGSLKVSGTELRIVFKISMEKVRLLLLPWIALTRGQLIYRLMRV